MRKVLFSYVWIVLFLVSAFVIVNITNAGVCTETYCDSDIQKVTTRSQSQAYSVTCFSTTLGSKMLVYWRGSSSTVRDVYLYVSTSSGAKGDRIGRWNATQSSGEVNYSPTATGTYTFILNVFPVNNAEFEVARTSCNVTEPSKMNDAPSMVQAFANSDSEIFVNWKDNATSTYGSYKFVVQRMKVTPNKPTSTLATPQQKSFNSSVISLTWKDNTTSTPYDILIEKSTSTEFISKCGTKFHCDSNFNQFEKISQVSPIYPSPNPRTENGYDNGNYTDNSVLEATTYYYRIRACSMLDLTNFYPSSTSVMLNTGRDSHPQFACSFPTGVFSTTTPPNAPTKLFAESTGPSSISLTWKNNSSSSSVFFKILRNGSYVATTTSTSFNDVGLSSCSEYTYEVKSCINKPNEICSTVNENVSATTYCVVNVSIKGAGKGSVSGSGGINCPTNSCSSSFSYGTYVTLTALPDASSTFQNWEGVCSNNKTSTSCSFTIDSDVDATAIFATTTKITTQGVKSTNNYISKSQTNLMASIVNSASTFVSSAFGFGVKTVEVFSEKVNSLFEKTMLVVKDSFSVLKKLAFSLVAPKQTKGETNSYDQYFVGVTTTTQPFLRDTGLLPNTFYVYRVKVHYNDGRESDWSNWAAGKTLYDKGETLNSSSTVCIANSICQPFNAYQSSDLSSYNLDPTKEKSESQCKVNADCVNVGRINVLIKEK